MARRKEAKHGQTEKTTAQRRAERFDLLYREGKARLGLLEPDIAAMLGVNRDTLRSYRRDPGKLPIEKAAILGTVHDLPHDGHDHH